MVKISIVIIAVVASAVVFGVLGFVIGGLYRKKVAERFTHLFIVNIQETIVHPIFRSIKNCKSGGADC